MLQELEVGEARIHYLKEVEVGGHAWEEVVEAGVHVLEVVVGMKPHGLKVEEEVVVGQLVRKVGLPVEPEHLAWEVWALKME